MQLEQLRYLILIHRLGSINKASEQVHLSQQALNTSMKKLEAEIGCPLFIYHARGVRLTDKGLRLVKTAEEVLAKMDDTLRELRETEPVLRDRIEPLTIFFTPAIGQLFMTNVTKVFSQAHPYVRFTLLEEEGATIRRLILEEDRPALGIVATFDPIPAADAAHTTISLYKDKLYILVAATHPLARQKSVSIRTLLKYPLAVYQSSYNIANPIRNLLEDCGTPNYQIITNSPRMYEDAILHQDCAGFINKAGLVNHAALQDILDEVIMLPVTNVPPIQMYAIVENTYLREHEQSISDFLAIHRSFC